ncbi:DUF2169 family type VI secretion system accessory protein [Paracoccus sp. (in: a-proteobacteria)]|uniref:DUF2169 family type VI secretion system accessory protein n=1 Tax=Paracoccus sp. TaxID=267 RepID=UPI003A8B7623
MRIRNLTPFAQLVYANEDAQGRLFDVLIVKQSYHFGEDFRLRRSVEQEPLNFSDGCFGAVNVTSLRYPSDLVPYKPATDVIVIADAFAPEGRPVEQWDVSVQAGALSKTLHVTGPREWRHRLGKWQLDDPEPVARVALRYDLAYGGECPGPEDEILTDERNPVGRGLAHHRHSPKSDPIPAPQILATGALLRGPFQQQEVAGFGPIPPAWLPRLPLGGTYDDDWVANTWPHWASDYDFAYHNSAATGLKADGFFRGDEEIVLTGLHPDQPELRFCLPGDTVVATLVDGGGARRVVRLNLDTVYIDILDARPEDSLIALTWRMAFLDRDIALLEIDSVLGGHPMHILRDEQGLDPAPHPSGLFTAAAEATRKGSKHVQ